MCIVAPSPCVRHCSVAARVNRVVKQPARRLFQPFELVILRDVRERLQQLREVGAAIPRPEFSRARTACTEQCRSIRIGQDARTG